ncbi:hypothetical protein B5X24_HaOG209918 [Helicoverpa armigera]|uniref:Uncharacterized protein n=1 Tax=Helicoverpa armigera TaxID=29058 RepID=A0A2W1BK26_HELAM|nr:hypothetical protein B5X24_HaOG209918 [Helicoverpa armigera]
MNTHGDYQCSCRLAHETAAVPDPNAFYIDDYRSLFPNYVPSSQATQVHACVHTPPPPPPPADTSLDAPELRGRNTSLRVERISTVVVLALRPSKRDEDNEWCIAASCRRHSAVSAHADMKLGTHNYQATIPVVHTNRASAVDCHVVME